MAIKKDRMVFDDWSGGHWGAAGPFKAKPDQYRAVNLQRYRNNTIGPRPGWKLLETTGTAPAPSAGSGSEFYGMAWVPGTTDGGYLVFISYTDPTACKALDMDTLVWSSALSIGVPPRDMLLSVANGGSVWSHQADWVLVGATDYQNLRTGSNAAISYPDSFAPRASVAYKARMYAWGDTTYPNRIYFSDPNNYGAMVSGQYFAIGNASTVMGAWNVGDALLILVLPAAVNGLQDAAEWWLLNGANPLTGSLRLIGKDTWPGAPAHATVFKNLLMFQDSFYDHGIMAHDGAELNTSGLSHLIGRSAARPRGSSSLGGAATVGAPAVILPYLVGASNADPTADVIGDHFDNGIQAWELVNGTWTKAVYWNGGIGADNPATLFRGITSYDGRKLIACTNDTSGGTGEYTFYIRDITMDRFNYSTDFFSSPEEEHAEVPSTQNGEAIPNILWLPAIQSEIGGGVRIRRVIVDVDYWKNSGTIPADTADLKCSVGNYRLEDGNYSESEQQQSDTNLLEDNSGSVGAYLNPKQARLVFRFDTAAFYSACVVKFADIRNMAIDRVTIDYESTTEDVR
jgi:hypothetical protein